MTAHFRRLGVPVVMGGIHATMCLDEVMEHVDSVVTGEAEGVWAEVLEDIIHGSLQREYDGGIADISDVPFARHDLLAAGYAFGAIQTSRGCPMNCRVTTFNGARYRVRPIPDVVREFQSVREKLVLVVDDNLVGARDQFLWIGDVGRGDLVRHFVCRVAQHALSADVEQLNDAFLIGGDTREVGAVEDRVLQGPGLEQSLLASDLRNNVDRAGLVVENGRTKALLRHVPPCPLRCVKTSYRGYSALRGLE